MRHLMNPLDFSVKELEDLFTLTDDIMASPEKYRHRCDGKILATCFYEPSTRTRLSFESAMLRLGGQVLGFASADSSSAAKGESVSDTIRIISCYADICAIRHPKEGAALVAATKATIPVINAGDGGHQHPTQTLTDLMTIHALKGSFDNMTIGLCGDLKFGRTVHSLINALKRYSNINFIFISPEELRIPGYIREDVLDRNHIPYREVRKLEDVMPELDILYMTRVQRERFFNEEDYVRLKDYYILNKDKMSLAKKDMMILHPLPRVNEISVEVDEDDILVNYQGESVDISSQVEAKITMTPDEFIDVVTGVNAIANRVNATVTSSDPNVVDVSGTSFTTNSTQGVTQT